MFRRNVGRLFVVTAGRTLDPAHGVFDVEVDTKGVTSTKVARALGQQNVSVFY
jgi:hypothetical protein